MARPPPVSPHINNQMSNMHLNSGDSTNNIHVTDYILIVILS